MKNYPTLKFMILAATVITGVHTLILPSITFPAKIFLLLLCVCALLTRDLLAIAKFLVKYDFECIHHVFQ